MADQKQIKIIKRGVDIWNAWRMDNPSIIPDLTEADLRGLKLQKIDFDGNFVYREGFGILEGILM